jgi:hypothetical protein
MTGVETDPGSHSEGKVFARYLLGVDLQPHLAERYAEACRCLFQEPPAAADAALVRFATGHSWSIAPLDAATALFRPDALLHRKILVLAAILEATPDHADRFLPKSKPLPSLLLTIAWVGISSAISIAIGLPLMLLAQRARA